jgi:hypothetical protein
MRSVVSHSGTAHAGRAFPVGERGDVSPPGDDCPIEVTEGTYVPPFARCVRARKVCLDFAAGRSDTVARRKFRCESRGDRVRNSRW